MVESYVLEWSSNKCPGDEVENSTTISGTLTNFTISDLRSDTNYSITVNASNAAGNSTSKILTVHTPVMGKVCVANGEKILYLVFTAPSGPPSSVNESDVTAFTITIQWGMVPCSAKNGDITGYSVTYMKIDSRNSVTRTIDRDGEMSGNTASSDTNANADESRSVCKDIMMGTMAETGNSSDDGHTQVANISSGLNVTLTKLEPSTRYSITVTAYNSAGIGPPSEPLIVETDSELYNNTRGKMYIFTE